MILIHRRIEADATGLDPEVVDISPQLLLLAVSEDSCMPTIDEKRVYTDTTDTESVYLGSELGILCVTVSDAVVGEFTLLYRGSVHDIATAGPYVAAATSDGVFFADHRQGQTPASVKRGDNGFDMDESQFHHIGLSIDSVAAVGFEATTADRCTLIAGDTSGEIYRLTVPIDDVVTSQSETPHAWQSIGTCSAVHAIDMPLIATADGVFQVASEVSSNAAISHAGLDTTYDIDAEPIAATADGLYVLANGWIDIPLIEQKCTSVDVIRSPGGSVRAHAVCGGSLYACDASDTGGLVADMGAQWRPVNLPITEPVVAVTHSPTATYAVTSDGTLIGCADIADAADNNQAHGSEDEWHHRDLGVTGVDTVAVSHSDY